MVAHSAAHWETHSAETLDSKTAASMESLTADDSAECWAAWLVVTTEQTMVDFLLYLASTKDVMKAAMKAAMKA